ncbi:hypothetical protein EHS25_001242 [Saitozyma podzolica]|uniref:Dihydroxyacetone synthase n=1 Tax=Saitozyma podzolica TaxID=1890683 RepID=A0A427YHS5_9TREE|nr:hypothetical protein EHS25_001242 [Saitozyma podzolica]
MIPALVLVTIALSLPIAVSATVTNGNGQTWAGCTNPGGFPTGTVDIGMFNSGPLCATACQAQVPPYQYAIAVPVFGTVVDCRCGNTPIATGNYITNTEATCFSTDNLVANTQQCFCDFVPTTTYSDCSNMGYVLTHPGGSAISRRRRNEQVALARMATAQLCPTGLSACRVRADSTDYECLDTQNEPESCGGCLLGEVVPRQQGNTADYRPGSSTDITSSSGVE